MMNVTTFQGKSSQRKPLRSSAAPCAIWNCSFFSQERETRDCFGAWRRRLQPSEPQQGPGRCLHPSAPICCVPCWGPSLPLEAKKQSLARYLFPLPAINSHPLMILLLAAVRVVFLYFGPAQLKPGSVEKRSHPCHGDVAGATAGSSNPISCRSGGTAGDAPWPGCLKKVSQGLLSVLAFTLLPS